MRDTTLIKRLSISRRVDLIFAFFRDARGIKLHRGSEADRANQALAREVQRQLENAIRDDREVRDGAPLEFTDEDLCPACGIPVVGHGLIETGKWQTRICAGVSGQNLFIIGPEAAQAFVEQLREKENDRSSGSGQTEGVGNDREIIP